MDRPFFSIVIPTKNRSGLLRDAISSVLLQNFDEYELIVSDNFNDERTQNVVNEFKNDKHLNYIRTDKELNMPDSWEFAAKNAKGIYTLVLSDRAFLKQGALSDIYNVIKQSKEDASVYFWPHGYFDEKKGVLWDEKIEQGVKILKSTDLIRNYIQTINTNFLPIPTTGCYRFDIAQKIRKDIGRLCMPVSPDCTGLLLLAYVDPVLYIPRPLVYFQGITASNLPKIGLNPWPYMNTLDKKDPYQKDPYQFVPIKAPIVNNLYFNDFLALKKLVGGNLKDINIDWVLYFVICYEELIGKMTIPGVSKEIQLELLEWWKKTLSNFDEKTQAAVWREIRRRYKNILKSYLRSSFLGDFLVRIKRFLLGKPTLKYPNALAAGGFSNHIESSYKEVLNAESGRK